MIPAQGGASGPLSAREHATIVAMERSLDRTPRLRGLRIGLRSTAPLTAAVAVVAALLGAAVVAGAAGFRAGTVVLAVALLLTLLHDLWRQYVR